MTEYERLTAVVTELQQRGEYDQALSQLDVMRNSTDVPGWVHERPRLDELWIACIHAAKGSHDDAVRWIYQAALAASIADNKFDVSSADSWLEYLATSYGDDFNLNVLRALVARQNGQLDRAAALLEDALAGYSTTQTPLFEDPWPVLFMAARNAAQNGDREGAVAYLTRACERDPENAELWDVLGNQLGLLGRHEEASVALARARALS